MQSMLRTEIIETKTNPLLSTLCHRVKNLYNRSNYFYKQAQHQQALSYYELDRKLKGEECYRILPAHTAQHTLKILIRNWKAFYQARKEWRTYPERFHGPPRPPKYKPSKGEMVAIISNQQIRLQGQWLIFPKKMGLKIKTRLTSLDSIREVRIVPRGVGYTIEIVYHKYLPRFKARDSRRKGAIDLGLSNLVTFVDNIGSRPIIIKDEGKGIKSITQYCLKKMKQLQDQYTNQQRKQLQKYNNLVYGKNYYLLKERWRRKVKEYFHQLSRFLVNIWKKRELAEIYIGYNSKWKQHLRLRKKTTQLFVIIPFQKLISLLEYKAAEEGIVVVLVEESHTSKCSFLDNESIQHHASYRGKRVQRGLYQSSSGMRINADVNAAYNILAKSDPQALPLRSVDGVGGYVMYPLRVSYSTMTSRKTFV